MSSSEKGVRNYELLEQVLLHLPLRDLLLSQRINKACFDVVFNSHAVARALFFKPSASVVEAIAEKNDCDWYYRYTWTWKGVGRQDVILPFLNPFLEM